MSASNTTIDGIKIEILKGQANYGRWFRDFKAVATVKGVWELFEGTRDVLAEPTRPVKPDMRRTRSTREDSAAAFQRDEFKEALEDYSLNIQEYKLELADYESNAKQVRTARALLAATVEPSIRSATQSKDTPKGALDEIIDLCKMQDSRALDLAIIGLENLSLFKCTSMTDYFNRAQTFRQDIIDLGSPYTENQLKSKILRGLTTQYDNFVDHFHLVQDDPTVASASLKTTLSMLLAHESKLKERNSKPSSGEKRSSNRNNDKDGDKTKKPRPKCTYEPCKKWGHDEKDCRMKRDHEAAKGTNDKSKDSNSPKPGKDGNPGRRQIAAMTGSTDLSKLLKSFEEEADDILGLSVNTPASMSQILAPESNADPSFQFCRKDGEGLDQGGVEMGIQGIDCESVSSISLASGHQSIPSNPSMAMSSSSDISPNLWIADTAASTHIVNDRRLFSKFKSVDLSIGTAEKDTSLAIKGAGTAHITMLPETHEQVDFSLTQAAYAPSSTCNLLSLPMLALKANLHGTWDRTGITFLTQEGDVVGRAPMQDGLYQVQTAQCPEGACKSGLAAATTDFDDNVWKWHRKLGHLSWEGMRKLLKQSTGMTITDKQIVAKLKAICPVCATTRALVKIPRDPARRRYQKVGQLLVVDTWGPYPVEGPNGVKFALFVTDDALRNTWVDPFSTKDQIPGLLKARCKKMTKAHECHIQRVRFDNEFENTEIRQWARERGIEVEPSVPYGHHQVGTDERVHRTVRERASAMIQEQTMTGQITKIITERTTEMLRSTTVPEFLWPEALRHAVWLKNRSPTKAHKNKKTPFEALHGLLPDLTRERIWGSRAYVAVPTELRGPKLHAPRGWLGYFVGCESEHIYRIWHPDEKKVKRISAARIDDEEGTDDTHDHPSITDRAPHSQPQANEPTPRDSSDSDEESSADTNGSSAESDDEDSIADESVNDAMDEPPAHDTSNVPINNDLSHVSEDDDGPVDNDDLYGVSEDDDGPVVSKFFAKHGLIALARKRSRDELDEDLDQEEGPADRQSDNSDSDEWLTDDDMPSRQAAFPPPKYFSKRRYEGDCDRCTKLARRCDGNRPCSTCILVNTPKSCKDQTESTKSQIPAKVRVLRQGEAMPTHLKCSNCFRKGLNCYKTDPNGPCTGCNIRGSCLPQSAPGNLKSTHDIPPREDRCARCFTKKRLCSTKRPCHYCQKDQVECTPRVPRKKGVPKEQKCHRCARENRRCDNVIPCETCKEANRRCKPQDSKKLPKCYGCGTGAHCDRNKPCGTCIRRKRKHCRYRSDDLLSTQAYPIDVDKAQDEDDDECRQCRDHKRNCNGTEPCYRYVRHREPVCSYVRRDGMVETYRARQFFTLNDENEIIRDESQIPQPQALLTEHKRELGRAAAARRKDRATAIAANSEDKSENKAKDSA